VDDVFFIEVIGVVQNVEVLVKKTLITVEKQVEAV
jgi:hypothetical protein